MEHGGLGRDSPQPDPLSRPPAIPAHTHALIVGIEQYDDWPLDGPLKDALGIREWLLRKGVPEEQIHLHLSPLPSNQAKLEGLKGSRVRQANDQALRQTVLDLKRLPASKADLLILYWAGHGLISMERQCLLLANARIQDMVSYSVENLRSSFSCHQCQCFSQQIFLFDTCRSFHRHPAEPPPSLELPVGERMHKNQFVFFSSQEGQAAINSGEEKGGLFTNVLLRKLSEEDDQHAPWPPDMERLALLVQASFRSKDGMDPSISQSPVWSRVVDWDGNATADPWPPIASSPSADGGSVLEAMEQLSSLLAQHLGMPSQRDRLVKDFQYCGVIGRAIAAKAQRQDAPFDDFLEVIDACLKQPSGLSIFQENCSRRLGSQLAKEKILKAFALLEALHKGQGVI